ncbi:lincosamide nucleotidyltransferase [Actinoplanes lutulentus]|uniref:Lincosamide nucleotidyltransferase n=1 Tax=Actinoplanes lutulentus TaxID=1287878 RepID=A0A327Z3F2_9ACTN|nr:lincosamide nucleotidyltransferase [Actinoplanes lutulentus]
MLAQEHLITRVKDLCRTDERLVAALVYGSFVNGEADRHSDIEFWLFAGAEATLDERAWLDQIGTIQHTVVNEFGTHVVFFPRLLRGEFHFTTEQNIPSVRTWPARSGPTDRMIVLDRTGALREALDSLPAQAALPTTPAEIDELCGRFANWLLLAHHVTQRGELLRAVDALAHTQRHLLWMARLAENRTQHWLTPSRNAESDLPSEVVHAIHRTTATADPDSLAAALTATWALGRRYWQQLGHNVPADLFADLDACL